jgi:hypothetical protein
MDVPPIERRAQKAFMLRDSRDMLEKLRWELNNLDFRQPYDIAACQYHSFNCAVTAWHVTDWLWHDISQLRDKLVDKKGKPFKECQDFQQYIREACPALRLCHQIANGSKHCLLTHNPDSTISTIISNGEGYDYGHPVILEGDTQHMAYKVFFEALVWLDSFLRDENIFPAEPFVPKGD